MTRRFSALPYFRWAAMVAALSLASVAVAADLVVPNATVGRNLEAPARIGLTGEPPADDLQLVLTSSDPGQLLLSGRPDAAGSASLTLSLKKPFRQSPEFWIQALGSAGTVTYTVTAPGLAGARGSVTLAPSAIVISGPFRAPEFRTTLGALASRLNLYTVRLNAAMDIAEQQAVAGGLSLSIPVASTNPSVGLLSPSPAIIQGGSGAAIAEFQPAAEGNTTLSLVVPQGFSVPAHMASVVAVVRQPNLVITDGIRIGENLEANATIGLGAIPTAPVLVTLKSSDPKRLLLSSKPTEEGSESLTVTVPLAGIASFVLQALAKEGTVTYTASAPGYATRTATITLTPSGVVVSAAPYGPPDEADVLRKEGSRGPRGFVSKVSADQPMPLAVWMVQLDPLTKRGADITVQPLRAGLSLNIALASSNPGVGKVDSPVKMGGGEARALSQFKPVAAGSVSISVETPEGFTTAQNSTSIPVLVME